MDAGDQIDRARLDEAEFRDLQQYTVWPLTLAMRFVPADADGWEPVAERWLALPAHPNILGALVRDAHGLVVHYAAINWRRRPLHVDYPTTLTAAARWGVQITEALSSVVANVPSSEAAWLSRIEPNIDLDDQIRLHFQPCSPRDPLAPGLWPNDVLRSWPACDERGFVFIAGKALSRLFVRGETDDARRLSTIVQRSLAPVPQHRYPTLAALRWDLVELGGRPPTRERNVWDEVEVGIGLLHLGDGVRAVEHFTRALAIERWSPLAARGLGRAQTLARKQRTAFPAYGPDLPWTDVEGRVARLEGNRAFAEALDLYRRTILEPHCDLAVHTGRARCHLHLGESGLAIDYAQRALALDPTHAEACSIAVNGHLMNRASSEALLLADRWLVVRPDDARAHYARGKCLLGLKRLSEARDCFDRAIVADPRLVPAMLLRREADRLLKEVRGVTGVQQPIDLPIPTHLSELRPLFVRGDVEPAIGALASERYTDDPQAQLLLAASLEFAQRFGDAAEIYERVSDHAEHRQVALLGRARMMIECGDPDGAIVLLDQLRADHPDDLDVIEGRAWALERLGRSEDAQVEFRRYVALDQGSGRRVRASWIQRPR